MNFLPHSRLLSLLAAAALLSGCATRKYARNKVTPVAVRVDKLEERSKTIEANLAEVEKTSSRADERAQSADSRVTEANNTAVRAAERATQADNTAGVARSLAESSFQKTQELEKRVNAFGAAEPGGSGASDEANLATRESVYFGVGSAALSKIARDQLDLVAARIGQFKRCVIEIQGYADPSGTAARNLELSQKRAESVARYLAGRHGVPLHRLHVLGMGVDKAPLSAAGKQKSRRVEVRVYSEGPVETKKLSSISGGK